MLNFQEMIAKLLQFWSEQGCLIHQGYDLEVGAGTFNPVTFLRCLGPEPYSAVYVEPSRRPQDGRFGENPNRLQFYHQMQVILKPSPENIQELYLQSLQRIGLNQKEHDIRFVHDDWENPTIGAWGLGWEVWADGMEITQFTYFQAIGGVPCKPVSGEITYGLERLAMYIQGVDSIFDLKWHNGVTYGDVFKRNEWEWSHYNFHEANTAMWFKHFEEFEAEAKRLIKRHLPIPAYDFVIKASHCFNILEARGVISVTERTGYIGRIRALAKELAEEYIQSRHEQSYPLLKQKVAEKQISLSPVSTKCDPSEREDFLLEIGSEELPATFVPIGIQNLEHLIQQFLQQEGFAFESLQTFATPRRLAVLIKGLSGGSAAKKTERKGPSLQAAFDAQGNLTQAGKGFFHSLNLEPASLAQIQSGKNSQLEIRKVKEVDYLFATLETPAKSTRARLAAELPQLILKIDFPKKMRWGDQEIEYARPFRWLCALYGKEILPFALGNLVSGRTTQGHATIANKPLTLNHAAEYETTLRENFVMANVKERRASILDQLHRLEEEIGGKAMALEKVMAQVLYLVEWPFLLAATFDARFLQTPKEVLISEMIEHQKYFPLARDEELLPNFIVVCNNKPSPIIRAGNQKALSPRLADGMFLFEEDLKIPLEKFNEKLKTVIFQKELGSVWAKVKRIGGIAKQLHMFLPICDLKKLDRAALLCKADLASDLVGEFPELQGTIGKIYALKQGEDTEVAHAIEEHWMPKGEKASLPKSATGILLSLAEKFDNFLGFYDLGFIPSSSSDPYALRRQALGILKILIENKYSLRLKEAFERAFEAYTQNSEAVEQLKSQWNAERKKTLVQEIVSYIVTRLKTLFIEYGFVSDEIEAVLSDVTDPNPYEIFNRLQALHQFRTGEHADFLALLEIDMRAKKILLSQKEKNFTTNQALFKHESERKLFTQLEKVKVGLGKELAKKNYLSAFGQIVQLKEPLHEFFDSVKVIDDDVNLRNNRLSLLNDVRTLCQELVDFSKIQEPAKPK